MKNIFLLLAITLLIVTPSCSNDDDGNSNNSSNKSISAKINGVEKKFKTIQVDPVVYPDYTDLVVTGTITGTSPSTIEMSLEKDNIDADVYFFQYSENGVYYQNLIPASFSVTLTQNSDNRLKGTFSGTLVNSTDPMNTIAVTEGVFDIKY